jgi:hypothetical protein
MRFLPIRKGASWLFMPRAIPRTKMPCEPNSEFNPFIRGTALPSVGLNSHLSSMTKWQKNLMAKKWTREKLSSAISNGDFFAT